MMLSLMDNKGGCVFVTGGGAGWHLLELALLTNVNGNEIALEQYIYPCLRRILYCHLTLSAGPSGVRFN